MELWEVHTQDQLIVLDLVMFTQFYSEGPQARFREFSTLVTPLLSKGLARIQRACRGGVVLNLMRADDGTWYELSEVALQFNAKHFTMEQPRATVLKHWRKSKTILFGCC